jgi:hypothetical protein
MRGSQVNTRHTVGKQDSKCVENIEIFPTEKHKKAINIEPLKIRKIT